MNDCIFRKSNKTCYALTHKKCAECSFYKSKLKYKKYYYVDDRGQKQVGVKER